MRNSIFSLAFIMMSLTSYASYTHSFPRTVIKVKNLSGFSWSSLSVGFSVGCKYGYEGMQSCGESRSWNPIVSEDGTITIETFKYVTESKRLLPFAKAHIKLNFGQSADEKSTVHWVGKLTDLNTVAIGLTVFKLPKHTFRPLVDGEPSSVWARKYGTSKLKIAWKADLALKKLTSRDQSFTESQSDEFEIDMDHLTLYSGIPTDETSMDYRFELAFGGYRMGPEWTQSIPFNLLQETIEGVSFQTDVAQGKFPDSWSDQGLSLRGGYQLIFVGHVTCNDRKLITGYLQYGEQKVTVTGSCEKYPFEIDVRSFPVQLNYKPAVLDFHLRIPMISGFYVPSEIYDLNSGELLGQSWLLSKWQRGYRKKAVPADFPVSNVSR